VIKKNTAKQNKICIQHNHEISDFLTMETILSIHETNMKLSTSICKSHLLLCRIRNLKLTLAHKAKIAGVFSLLDKDKEKEKSKTALQI